MAQSPLLSDYSRPGSSPIFASSISLGNLYSMWMNFGVQMIIHLNDIYGSHTMKLTDAEDQGCSDVTATFAMLSLVLLFHFNEVLAFIFFKKVGLLSEKKQKHRYILNDLLTWCYHYISNFWILCSELGVLVSSDIQKLKSLPLLSSTFSTPQLS